MPEQVTLYFNTAKEFLILCSNFILQPVWKTLESQNAQCIVRDPFHPSFLGIVSVVWVLNSLFPVSRYIQYKMLNVSDFSKS